MRVLIKHKKICQSVLARGKPLSFATKAVLLPSSPSPLSPVSHVANISLSSSLPLPLSLTNCSLFFSALPFHSFSRRKGVFLYSAIPSSSHPVSNVAIAVISPPRCLSICIVSQNSRAHCSLAFLPRFSHFLSRSFHQFGNEMLHQCDYSNFLHSCSQSCIFHPFLSSSLLPFPCC